MTSHSLLAVASTFCHAWSIAVPVMPTLQHTPRGAAVKSAQQGLVELASPKRKVHNREKKRHGRDDGGRHRDRQPHRDKHQHGDRGQADASDFDELLPGWQAKVAQEAAGESWPYLKHPCMGRRGERVASYMQDAGCATVLEVGGQQSSLLPHLSNVNLYVNVDPSSPPSLQQAGSQRQVQIPMYLREFVAATQLRKRFDLPRTFDCVSIFGFWHPHIAQAGDQEALVAVTNASNMVILESPNTQVDDLEVGKRLVSEGNPSLRAPANASFVVDCRAEVNCQSPEWQGRCFTPDQLVRNVAFVGRGRANGA